MKSSIKEMTAQKRRGFCPVASEDRFKLRFASFVFDSAKY